MFPPHAAKNDDEWRQRNVGRLLINAVARFEARVLELLAEQGHGEVPLAHLHLTRNLDRAGTRATELARRAAMTKQAMSEIIADCESIGLVRRVPDTTDARSKIVLFTDAGLLWLKAFKKALRRAELEMQRELGEAAMGSLKDLLSKYISKTLEQPPA